MSHVLEDKAPDQVRGFCIGKMMTHRKVLRRGRRPSRRTYYDSNTQTSPALARG